MEELPDKFDFYDHDNELSYEAQVLLTETVLSVIQLGDSLQREGNDILPVFRDTNLVFNPQEIVSAPLLLPSEFLGCIDEDDISLITISFAFRSLEQKPYFEMGFESNNIRLATITRPSLDNDEPFTASLAVGDKDYHPTMDAESVAGIIRQLLPAGYDYDNINDPQYPPHARLIIDTLTQAYNRGDEQLVDSVTTSSYRLQCENSDNQLDLYDITLYSLGGALHEAEICHIMKDEMYFDQEIGEPVHATRQIRAQIALDDYSHAVKFYLEENGDEPVELKPDKGMMLSLHETIEQLLQQIDDKQAETELPPDF